MNALASQIAVLNGRIAQFEAASGQGSANDLRDQRESLLQDLSQLVEFEQYEDESGAVRVTVGMRNLVDGTRTHALSAELMPAGDRELLLDGTNTTGPMARAASDTSTFDENLLVELQGRREALSGTTASLLSTYLLV